jgi:hypothetical protein
MRRLVLVAFLALGAALPVAHAAQPAPSAARLVVVKLRPLVVTGSRFKSFERVKMTLVMHATEVSTRVVRANPEGTFTAQFAVLLNPCSYFTVQAFGSKGSRAKTLPRFRAACIPDPGESSP